MKLVRVSRPAKLTAAERKAIAKKGSLAARTALGKAAGKRQRPDAKKNGIQNIAEPVEISRIAVRYLESWKR